MNVEAFMGKVSHSEGVRFVFSDDTLLDYWARL